MQLEGVAALEKLTESMEAGTTRLEDWDFTPLETTVKPGPGGESGQSSRSPLPERARA